MSPGSSRDLLRLVSYQEKPTLSSHLSEYRPQKDLCHAESPRNRRVSVDPGRRYIIVHAQPLVCPTLISRPELNSPRNSPFGTSEWKALTGPADGRST